MFFENPKENYTNLVARNNLDEIQHANIADVTLDEFKSALTILQRHYPDWQRLPITNQARAIITGLVNQIHRMELAEQHTSQPR